LEIFWPKIPDSKKLEVSVISSVEPDTVSASGRFPVDI
jgi:hypothetical protein